MAARGIKAHPHGRLNGPAYLAGGNSEHEGNSSLVHSHARIRDCTHWYPGGESIWSCAIEAPRRNVQHTWESDRRQEPESRSPVLCLLVRNEHQGWPPHRPGRAVQRHQANLDAIAATGFNCVRVDFNNITL